MRRNRTQVATAVATVLAAASGAAMADVPKLSEILDGSGIAVTGFVAASYYHSNGYPSNIHQFDIDHDTFQLDQADLAIAYQPKEGFGAYVELLAGEDARLVNAAENGTNSTFNLKQAYAQYATGPLTVIAGKFVTLAGAEVISVTGNTNFSRSLLFFDAEPLTHTGVRATYAVTDQVSLVAGVNNGWNSTSTSFGSKTGELGVAFTPNKIFAATAQAYVGKTQGTAGTLAWDGEKSLVDVVLTYNATSQLTFVLNGDYDRQDNVVDTGTGASFDAKWYGIAAYANYAINDNWRVSLRGEYLKDKDGFISGANQSLKEGTITVGYDPTKVFELRVEVRYDKAGEDIFTRAVTFPEFSNNLFEFALQGVYKFPTPTT